MPVHVTNEHSYSHTIGVARPLSHPDFLTVLRHAWHSSFDRQVTTRALLLPKSHDHSPPFLTDQPIPVSFVVSYSCYPPLAPPPSRSPPLNRCPFARLSRSVDRLSPCSIARVTDFASSLLPARYRPLVTACPSLFCITNQPYQSNPIASQDLTRIRVIRHRRWIATQPNVKESLNTPLTPSSPSHSQPSRLRACSMGPK